MKKLFLTGGRGDIGSAIKKVFEDSNYQVIAPSSDELNLEKTFEIKDYFKDKDCDFSVFVHCAGINTPKKLSELSLENIEKTIRINYLSFYELVKILSPKMIEKKQGKIVAISSVYGLVARVGRLAYTSSKHALNGCVKNLACELAKDNILVNCVSPGFVNTKMTAKNNSAEKIQQMIEKIPMNRLASVEEIANVVYFLCSEKNSYITGQNIIADGGFMASGGQGLWE